MEPIKITCKAFKTIKILGWPKNLPANAGDMGSIPGSGRPPGEGNGNPFQHSCLGNPMNRVVWWDTVYGVTKELDMTQ